MKDQLLFQRSTGLNEQATVDCLVGNLHTTVVLIPVLSPSRNLLWRPVILQLVCNDPSQFAIAGNGWILSDQKRWTLVIKSANIQSDRHYNVRVLENGSFGAV